MSIEDHNQQWGDYTHDYNTGHWLKEVIETPFLEAQFKSFVDKRKGAPWKALDVGCGMGTYSVKLMQAGASYVLASDACTNMVAGAQKETEKYLLSQSGPGTEKSEPPRVDFHVCSASNLCSMPGAQEGTFDLAICLYVLCNLPSEEEVKQALVEVFKLLKPGGKFMIYEPHIVEYLKSHNDGHAEYIPKEDGTEWKYFEDEGKPRKLRLQLKSTRKIEIVNRFYTLSFWMAVMLEVGFQITQFHEPHADARDIPADAPGYMKYYAECPSAMFWECTKPSQ